MPSSWIRYAFDARTGIVGHVLAACVGALSVAIVTIGGDRYAMWSRHHV